MVAVAVVVATATVDWVAVAVGVGVEELLSKGSVSGGSVTWAKTRATPKSRVTTITKNKNFPFFIGLSITLYTQGYQLVFSCHSELAKNHSRMRDESEINSEIPRQARDDTNTKSARITL